MKAIIGKYQERKKLSEEFYRIFKVSLSKFLNPFTGFNIIMFDDYLIRAHGDYRTSMKAFIGKKYGKDGVGLIEKLI